MKTSFSKNLDIRGLSLAKLFWIQHNDNRVSFTWDSLPNKVHFTISWKNELLANLHISKNTGEHGNKPHIKIATWEKNIIDELTNLIAPNIYNKIFIPFLFKNYSRRLRKTIRVVFFDDLEKHRLRPMFEQKCYEVFEQNSYVVNKQLKIRSTFENDFIPLAISSETKSLLLENLKWLNRQTFKSQESRGGIILLGKKVIPFISMNNTCYRINEHLSFYELLCSFMKPEFVNELIDYIETSIKKIANAHSYEDTENYNRPYRLFIESSEIDSENR